MPMKPKKPCKHPGCPKLTSQAYCELHVKEHVNKRPSARNRGYDSRWRIASKRFLKVNPICKHCEKEGKITAATVVDHVIPHRGNRIIFWDESNWQPLCKECHDRKTMTEDRYVNYKY